MTAEIPQFPRTDDGAGWAWGLDGETPAEVWERFSPAYEAQAERVMRAVAARGLTPSIDGAGSEDGEFVAGQDPAGTNVLLVLLEEPASAREIAGVLQSVLAAPGGGGQQRGIRAEKRLGIVDMDATDRPVTAARREGAEAGPRSKKSDQRGD